MALVNTVSDILKELIMPGIWIVEGFGSLFVEIHGEVTEKIYLSIGGRFFEHLGYVDGVDKYTV